MHKKFQINVQAFIKNQDKYLLLKRNQKWTIPGGRVEDDATLEAALSREILEETGIANTTIKHILTALLSDSKETVLLYFLVETDQTIIRLSPEHDDYKWVNEAELSSADWEHPDLKKIVLAYL